MSERARFGDRVTPPDVGWPRHRAGYVHVAARVEPGACVLDAGCGIGYHVSPLTPARLRRLLRDAGLRPVLYGQARDRGLLHVWLQALDPLGLRLRVPPRRRAVVAGAIGAASGRNGSPTDAPFRFSRALARSAAIVFVEARKP